jgi:hypothetical protein
LESQKFLVAAFTSIDVVKSFQHEMNLGKHRNDIWPFTSPLKDNQFSKITRKEL